MVVLCHEQLPNDKWKVALNPGFMSTPGRLVSSALKEVDINL